MSRPRVLNFFALSLVSCALSLVIHSNVRASFVNLGPAGDFNVFVFNDNTQGGTDAQGKVAVGGNAYFAGSYTVASQLGNSTNNLIVGGNLTNSGTTFHGGMIVGGDVNWSGPTIGGAIAVNGNATFTGGGTLVGPVSVVGTYTAPNYYPAVSSTAPTALPLSFSDVENYLVAKATYLASLPATGTTTIAFNQVHLTANSPLDTYISFNVTGAQMSAAAGAGLYIDAPANSTVVVNVSGNASSMTSMGIALSGGIDKQHVLYNFYEATDLTLAGIGVLGTILAPVADVHFNSGAIDGTLIANNLQGGGESHLFLFQGHLPFTPVPEPSTLVLGALGLVGAGAYGFRRRRAGR